MSMGLPGQEGAQSGDNIFQIRRILVGLKNFIWDIRHAGLGTKSDQMQIAGSVVCVPIAAIELFTNKSETLGLVRCGKRIFLLQSFLDHVSIHHWIMITKSRVTNSRTLVTYRLIGTSNVVTVFLAQVTKIGDLFRSSTMIHTQLIDLHILRFRHTERFPSKFPTSRNS
jgi:hypothetical protein